MAANKFATMLHRNTTNRVVVILVYTVLEWILIFLLLLNSFFSFLISQFASYFGLQQPCILCSRIDHHLTSSPSSSTSYTHLICESHAKEIFCNSGFGMKDDGDEDERDERMKIDGVCDGGGDCFSLRDGTEEDLKEEESLTELEFVQNPPSSSSEGHHDRFIEYCLGEDHSLEIIGLNYHNHGDDPGCEFDRLVPVELIDSSTSAFQDGSFKTRVVEHENHRNQGLVGGDDDEEEVGEEEEEEEEKAGEEEEEEEVGEELVLSIEMSITDQNGDGSSVPVLVETSLDSAYNANITEQELESSGAEEDMVIEGRIDEQEDAEMIKPEDPLVQEEVREDTTLVIVDHESQQVLDRNLSVNQVQEEPTPFLWQTEDLPSAKGKETESPKAFDEQSHTAAVSNGPGELHLFEPIDNSVDKSGERGMDRDHVPTCPEPTDSWAEESLDGSVRSETESSDPVITIERLKESLKSERKSLNALYAELEEERNASAIAANQTMAMINRLQEEKAAMQMEALQYQRMMEEQSEYDQEALQLLNELMVKREREKQELEKELDVYRKRVLEYDAKEKLRFVRRRRSGNSSATCSNGEEIDELSSIDLNREAKNESESLSENPESSVHHDDENISLEEIAMDCVKHMTSLDDSLAEFEDERLSILDQLKELEEKLLNLSEANEVTDDVDSVRQSLNCSYDVSTAEENGDSHELSNEKDYPERKTMSSMAKILLPFLDAAEDDETGEGLIRENNVDESGIEDSPLCRFDSKQLAIEDEVDHVYERLQALEADREFLKHCMSSIQKGDKGMDLLQEILQHLRDLKSVEIRVRSMSESPLS
ncbi:Myosin-binding protein 3 [Linum perenne]